MFLSLSQLDDKGKHKHHIQLNRLFPRGQIRLWTGQEGTRLYVNVNVTEHGTLENDTIEDTSTFIAHPYYDVIFVGTKDNFRPGFPFTVTVSFCLLICWGFFWGVFLLLFYPEGFKVDLQLK